MPITFSGLASGLDSASLVDQLVASEKARSNAVQTKVTQLTRQGNIVDDLVSRLKIFATTAKGFSDAAGLRSVKTDRSDTTHAAIAASSTATDSSHTLRVTSTARGQTVASRTFASDAAGVLGDGSVSIASGAGAPVLVSWTAADSLADVAQRINDSGSAATAAVLFDGTNYRLVTTSRASGTAAAPVFTDAGDGLGLADPGHVTLAARDAVFDLDGITITRGTNVVSDVLPGVTLTLSTAHTASEPDTMLTVATDRDATRTKVTSLVDAWNTIDQGLDGQLTYTGTKKGNDTLFGDATLRALQGALGGIASSEHGGKTLASIGVSLDRSGRLSLDQTKFDAALSADPNAVEKLFVTGGLAAKMTSLVDTYTRSGDGVLISKGTGYDARIASYQKDITRIENAATSLGERLTRQFTALEKAISAMKTQSTQLMSVLGLS